MIVEELYNNIIVAKINLDAFKSDTVMIPRITLNSSEGEDVPLQWTQFSIQSCFAVTIYKEREQTMENYLFGETSIPA